MNPDTMPRESLRQLMSFDDALERVLDLASPIEHDLVALDRAMGCVLARGVAAPFAVPRFTQSAMDGYAVISDDTAEATAGNPILLDVEGESAAGRPFEGYLSKYACCAISTGARLPQGCDAVVPWEAVRRGTNGRSITLTAPVAAGAFVRHAGEDVAHGAVLFRHGTRVDAAGMALLASFGIAHVDVMKPPRVAVLTGGDELIDAGSSTTAGLATDRAHVVDSNSVYLAQELRAFGAEVVFADRCSDNPDAFDALLGRALAARPHLIVSSGGIAGGDHDVVASVLARRGAEITVRGVAMRPAKPTTAARVEGVAMVALPGNPVSAFAGCELFVKPLLRRMLGIEPVLAPRVKRRLGQECPRDQSRFFFVLCDVRVGRDGIEELLPLAHQSSGNFLNATRARAFALVEAGKDPIKAGTLVDAIRLGSV